MRGVRLLAAALVAADGLQGRQTPRRASCRVRAGAGFGAPKKAGTTKARRKRPRPPTRAAPARPALDKWGLPVAEPEDEDAPRDLGARKVSLEAPPVAVAAAGAALAHAKAHPVDLGDPRLAVLHLDPPVYRVQGFLSTEECAARVLVVAGELRRIT